MKDPLKGVLIISAALALAAVVTAAVCLLRPHPAVLGRQGEWVTRPDGRKVCRLAAPLLIYSRIDSGFCEDWQEPEPRRGTPIDGWIRTGNSGLQIMIEGKWRPDPGMGKAGK